MLRFLLTVIIVAVLVYFAATVPIGHKTLFGHIRAIWHTEEVQDLKNGVEDKAGPAIDRMRRGVKAGLKAAEGDDNDGSAGVTDDGSATARDGGVYARPVAPAAP